jgi:drug/metabolite transporter (DMT)-like permease
VKYRQRFRGDWTTAHEIRTLPDMSGNAAPQPKPKAKHGYFYLMAALPPLFWSGNFLVARIMHDQIPPIQMSLWRWAFAFIILVPFAAPAFNKHRACLRNELPFLIILGGVGITAFNCFIYAALHDTTVVNAALINTLMPVFTFVLAALILRETLGLKQMLGVGVALMGAALIIIRGDLKGIAQLALNPGDLLVVAGLAFWALYTVLIRWRPTDLPILLFLTVTIGFGIIIHLPFVAWEIRVAGTFTPNAASLAALAYFALFPSVLAYIFWNKAVATLGPGRTGMFIYLMPVFSSVLGIAVLGEAFHLYHGAGIALIFVGIALVTRKPH